MPLSSLTLLSISTASLRLHSTHLPARILSGDSSSAILTREQSRINQVCSDIEFGIVLLDLERVGIDVDHVDAADVVLLSC